MKTSPNRTLIAAVVFAMGMAMSGCEKKIDPPPPPPEVGVIVIQPQSVSLTTELPGRTVPHLIVEVQLQVGGIIQKRFFIEGSDVKAGQILYQIDPARYREAYNNAKAALAGAEANLGTIQLREERYRDLLKIHAVSRQDYHDTSAALKQAKADVEGAGATLETARINLDYTRVEAPISGRIGRSSVTDGALVTANQAEPLAVIQELRSRLTSRSRAQTCFA